MISRFAAGTAALFLMAAAPALAQEADSTAPAAKSDTKSDTKAKDAKAKDAKPAAPATPVDVVANEMEILDKEKKAIFRGSVDATKGTTNFKSDTLTVTYKVGRPAGAVIQVR